MAEPCSLSKMKDAGWPEENRESSGPSLWDKYFQFVFTEKLVVLQTVGQVSGGAKTASEQQKRTKPYSETVFTE